MRQLGTRAVKVTTFLPVGFVALLLSTAVPTAQQKPPVFKSNVELINVDVVVTDKDGNAVRGLPQDAFALTDRKKLQTVSTFEEVSHERSRAATPAPHFPATMKMDIASNTTVQADRLVMVVVDDLHIWKGRTDKARELTRDVIVKLGEQASMAVLFTSGDHSTQITQDRSVLLAASDTLKARQSVRRPHQANDNQRATALDPEHLDAALDTVGKSQGVQLQDFEDNMRLLSTMQEASKMLRAEDQRRKAFVLISEGIDKPMTGVFDASVSPCETVSMNNPCYHDRALRDMMEQMRRSSVATYALDPRGKVKPEDMALELFPPPGCAVCSTGGSTSDEDSTFRWDNPIRRAQDGLTFLTEASGGFAVTDTDDLTAGLQHIIEDIDHYYLLGFYPSDTSGGDKYRPLDVTVPGHPDYRVRFRRGYVPGATRATHDSKNDPLVALATGLMPKSDLPLRLTAMPLVGKGKTANVAIALEVTTPTGVMKDADNKLRDDVSYSVLVVDDKKAKVTQREGRAASFSMSARDASQAMPDSVTYQIPLTIDLPPGQYQLRASATSKKLGKGGSVYMDVTVPDFSKESLVLSGITLGYADGSRVPVGRTPTSTAPAPGAGVAMGSSRSIAGGVGAATASRGSALPDLPNVQASQNRLPFDPSLSREFSTTDSLRAYLEVARKDMKSTVSLTIMILGGNNTPMMAIDRVVGPNDPGKVEFRVPPAPLGPGTFVLRVTATDSHSVTKTETGLVIK